MIGCFCVRFDPSCCICQSGKKAYEAGKRAYRCGRSRRVPPSWEEYGYRWRDGWYEGRNANPNTAKAREKERAKEVKSEIRYLTQERNKTDKQIARLRPTISVDKPPQAR